MAELIQKCGYIKAGGGGAYMKYIATRDGVEIITGETSVTKNQQELISNLLRDFPDVKDLFEYTDYVEKPSSLSASSFITAAIDSNAHSVQDGDIYMKYIATRPRAEKHDGHGLFGAEEQVDLDTALFKLQLHKGNVWTIIYSLRREDAERLGYNNAEKWRDLLLLHSAQFASVMGIPQDKFHWYAAYHDEGSHPHVHMMIWSESQHQGFLTKEGAVTLRSKLTNEIFKQDLHELYVQKDLSYKELTSQARETMSSLLKKMQGQVCDSPVIEQKMQELVIALGTAKGKKQYGYLPKSVKEIVDSIVDELAKQPEVAACYGTWNKLRDELERYYKDKPREHLPLSAQKEFRAIKNMVIWEAENIRLGVTSFEDGETENDPVSVEELEESAVRGDTRAMYRLGKLCFSGEHVEKNTATAVAWFRQAAEQGDSYAQYVLGKLYLQGREVPQEREEALRWLEFSAAQGNVYAQYLIDRMDAQREPSIILAATKLLHHASRIFREQAATTNPQGIRMDSRRRKQLLQKRLALGHKIDDHEDQVQGQQTIT